MKLLTKSLCVLLVGLGLVHTNVFAQTDGQAKLEVTLLDYNGSSAKHWAVVWVTTQAGTFIKSLRKQGPAWTATHWDSHCSVWNSARGGSASGSQALDGYSSATAQDYTGTNSPIILTWNCRDASNNLMADGSYKIWVQYAEDSGQGPHTTNGLLWTKGPAGATNSYANFGANFASIKVTWIPTAVATVAPSITSTAPTATGTVGVPYSYTCAATGTAPIKFSATNLPVGLTISTDGLISGTPMAVGPFAGTITATNGTLPNATQAFSIDIVAVPVSISSIQAAGGNLVMSGTGPANGVFAVLTATNVSQALGQWTPIATNVIGGGGSFSFTNAINPGNQPNFYRLRLP